MLGLVPAHDNIKMIDRGPPRSRSPIYVCRPKRTIRKEICCPKSLFYYVFIIIFLIMGKCVSMFPLFPLMNRCPPTRGLGDPSLEVHPYDLVWDEVRQYKYAIVHSTEALSRVYFNTSVCTITSENTYILCYPLILTLPLLISCQPYSD